MDRLNGRWPLFRSTAGAAVLVLGFLAGSAQAQERSVAFNIPAESLSKALRDYGRAADRQLIFTEDLVGARRAPAIVGNLSADDALGRILAGSGLTWRTTASGGVMIVREANPRPQIPAVTGGDEPVSQIDAVIVTGTHIRGGNQVSPIIEVGRLDIERGGFLDIGQALRNQPVNFGGGVNPETFAGNVTQDGAGNNGFHSSSANLYGLGSGATLTLLNGRRLPPVGQGVSVDLALVPLVAVDRIEVLADGASAIYGADAVAGVVNIITRRSYNGAEARLRYGGAQGGLETKSGSFITGGAIGGLDGVFGIERLEQSGLATAARAASRDHAQPTDLFGDTSRTSYFGALTYDLTPRIQATADGVYMQRFESGPRNSSATSTNLRRLKVGEYALHAGLRADVGGGWTLEGYGTLNGNTGKDSSTDVRIATGQVTSSNVLREANRLRSVELSASGPLLTLPAGPIRAALGAAYRDEQLRSGAARDNAGRHVSSAYGEIEVPLFGGPAAAPSLQSLTFTAAARYDDYSDFGGKAVPKIGLLWRLSPELAVGVTASKSFRAPSMFELTHDYFISILDVKDATSSGVSRAMYVTGTGRPVGPERADNFNATVTYTPRWVPRAKLALTYYRVSYDDRLAGPDPTFAYSADIRGAPATLLTRTPTQAELDALLGGARGVQTFAPNPSTPIAVVVDVRTTNVSATLMEGVHATATYSVALGTGNLVLSWDGNYLAKFTERLLPGSPEVDRVGKIYSPTRWRSRATAQWTGAMWSAAVFWNYVGDYVDNRVVSAPVPVKAWNTFDASLSYAFGDRNAGPLRRVRLILSATNLFDAAPPMTAPKAITHYTWDATNASIIGRFMSLEVVKRW